MSHRPVTPDRITHHGQDLARPECVLAGPGEVLYVSDARGAVTVLVSNGSQRLIRQAVDGVAPEGSMPNGLCLGRDGRLLIANMGLQRIEVMDMEGNTQVICDRVDGQPLGHANFVQMDDAGRIWFSVSTRRAALSDAVSPNVADGYLAVIEDGAARIVADGLVFPNEFRIRDGFLYLAQTFAKRISRFALTGTGLGPRETFGPDNLGDGFPDGILFDAAGNLWITLLGADRLVTLSPTGRLRDLMHDGDPEAVAAAETAYGQDRLELSLLGAAKGTIAPLTTSLAFMGGRVWLGSLAGSRIASFPLDLIAP